MTNAQIYQGFHDDKKLKKPDLDALILKYSCKLTKNLLTYENWHQTTLLSLGYKTF